jgi:hypothetical protein
MSSDQKIIRADRLAGVFQFRSDVAVFGIGGTLERKNVYFGEQILDGFERRSEPFLAQP